MKDVTWTADQLWELVNYSDNRFVCDFSAGLKFIAIEILMHA